MYEYSLLQLKRQSMANPEQARFLHAKRLSFSGPRSDRLAIRPFS